MEYERINRVHRVDAIDHLSMTLERVLLRLRGFGRVEELDGNAPLDGGSGIALAGRENM